MYYGDFQPDYHYLASGLNSDFYGAGLSFTDYIAQTQAMIKKARLNLITSTEHKIILANSPYEIRPKEKIRYGVLLVHGLLDSPFVMQDLAHLFLDEPALVRSVLLPGHGTRPGELTIVKLEAWQACIEQAIQWMQQDVDQLVIIGFSTGASLALEYVLKHNLKIPLVLIAPVFSIQNPLTPFTGITSLIGKVISLARWVHQQNENDYAKYRSMAMNGVYQVYRLTKNLKALTQEKRCEFPIFMLASNDDEVVSVASMQTFFSNTLRADNQFWIYGNDQPTMKDTRIRILPSNYPKQRILNFSHVTLVNSPDNPHYGMNGDFKDLGHYHTWWGKLFTKPNKESEIYFGALNQVNLRKHVMQRLTYNPGFDAMGKAIVEFVHRYMSD